MRKQLIIAMAAASMALPLMADTPRHEPTATNVEDTTTDAAKAREDALWPFDRPAYKWLQETKKQVRDRTGLEWALEYTTIYQMTSGGIDAQQAAEGTMGFSSLWKLLRDPNGIDAAGIGFQAETRANYMEDEFTEMTGELGTLWSPNDSTSGSYDKINQLWWGQKLAKGRFTYLLGKIDPGAHINGNRFAGSGNTQFFGQPFATNPARAFPDNGMGAMGRVTPTDWLYAHAVISDSDAVSSYSPFKTINGNWFYAGEIGLTPRFGQLGQGMYRFMVWQRDTDSSQGTGCSLSFDQNLTDHVAVFGRYGINNGELNAVEQIAAAGVSLLTPFWRRNDQTGIGVSWTRPSDHNLRDEFSTEAYYRLQLTAGIELSASAQLVVDPSANDRDSVGIFGLRLRILY